MSSLDDLQVDLSPALPVDIAVVGTGPAGLAAALALAHRGLHVALVGPAPDGADPRTAALFTGSINLLRNLGVWEACRAHCAGVRAIRIIDAMDGVLRAPESLFTAAEAGPEAAPDGILGYNVPNGPLATALADAVDRAPRIDWSHRARVEAVTSAADAVTLSMAGGGRLAARLAIAADGRASLCRDAAGITTRRWRQDQAAVVTRFTHSRPHRDVSTEFHRRGGPLTVVPMPGRASSLVWVDRTEDADHLMTLTEGAFRDALERHLAGLLGAVREIAPRASFPLTGMTATRFAQNRVALVGESAHVFPPIGAQGLNLGLRDIAVLADVLAAPSADDVLADGIAASSACPRDPGAADTLAAYDTARQGDIATRTVAVTALGLSLTSGHAPVDLARGLGLHVISRVPPLKRALIREGLAPANVDPTLMRRQSA